MDDTVSLVAVSSMFGQHLECQDPNQLFSVGAWISNELALVGNARWAQIRKAGTIGVIVFLLSK
jgi:hypothetical protein